MGILFVDNGEVRTFDLNGSSTIGRDGTNDIVVKHPTVSRHHARIDSDNGRYFLTDFSSRNGTRVNGRAIRPNEPLADGARLRIGHIRAWFYVQMPNKLPRSLSAKDTGILFHCACGQRLWSAGDTAGMTVVCNACNQNVEVPEHGNAEDDSAGTVAGVRMADARHDASDVCGICQWPIAPGEQPHVCASCKTPAHMECWLENRGCSTYGCEQVNALLPKQRPAEPELPAAVETLPPEIVPLPPEPKHVAWGHMLLGLSVVASLLGLLAFGVPAAVLSVIAFVRLLVTRNDSRTVLAASTLIGLLGTAAGVMISRFWWLNVPLF